MDITNLYHTAVEKTYDEDRIDIITIFKGLIKQGKTGVKLVNFYRGMPLVFPAKLVSLDHASLELDVHSQQAVAISHDRFTFIRCEAFPKDVGAHVQYVNVRKKAVTLTNFFYARIMAEKRHALRLSLDPPSDVTLKLPEGELRGKLLDISTGGMAVCLEHLPECEGGFEAVLQFALPNLVRGTVETGEALGRHIGTLQREHGYICTFAISHDKKLDHLISQYLFQRQVEIIRKLKEESL